MAVCDRCFLDGVQFMNQSPKPSLLHCMKWQHVFWDAKCHCFCQFFPAFTLPLIGDRVTKWIDNFRLRSLFSITRGFSSCWHDCSLPAHFLALVVFWLMVIHRLPPLLFIFCVLHVSDTAHAVASASHTRIDHQVAFIVLVFIARWLILTV